MEKILTISVAAYNMESYLRQTLDSLTIPEIVDDLEVFVIDDGGQDGSLEIAREYEARYPLSFHAVHKENGGYGTTINYSMAHATGKYFKLLDGDDWFDREGLVQLIGKLKQVDVDIVVTCTLQGCDAQSMALRRNGILTPDRVLKVAELDGRVLFSMWDVTYRTELLRSSKLELPGRILYTDRIYTTVPFAFARTILQFNTPPRLLLSHWTRGAERQQGAAHQTRKNDGRNWRHVEPLLCGDGAAGERQPHLSGEAHRAA